MVNARRTKRSRTANDRIVVVLTVGWGLLVILWGRCVWLQMFDAKHLSEIAQSQHESNEALPSRRGTIFDRKGRPLAISVTAPSVYANARRIDDKSGMAKQLADAVGRDAHMIRSQLNKDRGFVWIARQLDPVVTASVLPLRPEGVGMLEEQKRLYPQGRLAGHIVGFTDIDQHGLEGMELSLNSVLQGQDGSRSTLRDAKGNLLVGPWTNEVPPVDGQDVVLNIDSVVQQAAEEELEWGVKKYHAKGGSIIVMDPYYGEIWAIANSPSYDPNEPAKSSPDGRRNRSVTDVFEPGSIFKMIAASALLEEHRITPDEKIFCENGSWPTVAHHILHDHRPHGMLSFHDVIVNSSNIGTAKAAQRLKPDELYKYIRAFGIGQRTGIDMPGEVSGLLHPPAQWSKLSPYIIPIGQEVATTPIQLTVMTAAIANGGLRVRPYIVSRIQTKDGQVLRTAPAASPERIISRETAEIVQDMLKGVVASGTGQLANVPGLTVAGKTGTAQKLEPTGRYSHSRFVASFVGFGPVPDARFVMAVSIDEPRPLYFGGVVAAPIFKRIIERLASYWELERHPAQEKAEAELNEVAKD